MRSLQLRIDEIVTEKKKQQENKKKENDAAEIADCSFAPTRYSSKTSDLYLKRMGREAPIEPEDLFRYQQDKHRRNELRRQILNEIEEKELTFKPQLNDKSIKIQERLRQQGAIDVDQITRTTLTAPTRPGPTPQTNQDETVVVDGPMLVVESQHPYRHNTCEYSTVAVPGAVSYSVSFADCTRTEAIYDFVRFYDDDTHTHHFGSGKYSGGCGGSPMNWPGIGPRPPLFIPASKFVIFFKTNGTVRDWGFRMHITPHISVSVHLPDPPTSQQTGLAPNQPPVSSAVLAPDPHIPVITEPARNLDTTRRGPVHERLYQQGVEKKTDMLNYQADLLQSKIKNVPLKPWETVRDVSQSHQPAHKFVKMHGKSFLAKATLADAIEELLLPVPQDMQGGQYGRSDVDYPFQDGDREVKGDGQPNPNYTTANYSAAYAHTYTAVEFDDSLANLWRDLRSS